MGTCQSKPTPKESLYDLLRVERTATQHDLKKSYRKIALELHPDRNYNNEEEATTLFVKVQAAYEVLSNPDDREWYDTHGEEAKYSEYSAQITQVEEIKGYLEDSYSMTLDFQKDEVYRLIAELFERLKNEELEAAFDQGQDSHFVLVSECPNFGHVNDEYPKIRGFYDVWEQFQTTKQFQWEDLYKVDPEADRKTRRTLEARNKRVRDAARREYNDAVRQLARLIRSKDIRVKAHKSHAERQLQIQKRKQSEQQKTVRAAQSKEKQRLKEQYQEQDWEKIEAPDDEPAFSSTLLSTQGEYECVVCDEFFATKRTFIDHEMSPSHTRALKKLQKDMLKDDQLLFESSNSTSIPPQKIIKKPEELNTASIGLDIAQERENDNHDEGAFSVDTLLNELDSLKGGKRKEVKEPKESSSKSRKMGKARQKRLTKAAVVAPLQFKCSVCQTEFVSRGQFIEHGRISRHF